MHADEPLRRGAEDQRRLGAPAVGKTVGDLALGQKAAFLGEQCDDLVIHLVDMIARETGHIVPVVALVIDIVQGADAVSGSHHEVVHAVIRRGVDAAGTGVGGDVIAKQYRHLALAVEGVLQQYVFQRRALDAGDDLMTFGADLRQHVVEQGFGENQALRPTGGVQRHHHVVELGAQGHRAVCRQRPGRGGPDGDGDFTRAGERAGDAFQSGNVHHRKAHIDRERGLVLILYFRFRQRGRAHHAPVDRFVALHQVTVLGNLAQGADGVGFNHGIHGEVGIVPIADHTEAHEIALLALDLLGGVFAALLAEGFEIDLFTRLADLLLDIVLDGQTVAVPAGHIGRVISRQDPRLDDDVLEHLVDRVTDVNVAIGVGRAIVKNEFVATDARRAQLAVQVEPLGVGRVPFFQHVRLPLGQVGLHGETGFRQVEGRLVVFAFVAHARRSVRPLRAK